MSEKKSADESIGIFLGDRSPIAVPLKPLHVGPGAPGPGDEWKVPTGQANPDAEAEVEADASLDPAHPADGRPSPAEAVSMDERPVAEMGHPETDDAVTLEPVHSNGTVVLPLHPADEG
jgi:hypothetical protein